ncbi:MAG: bifunctional folylpolyglutamate synthase/dihydrofolate synthase [Prevotellaceae bacterium]|jgi:dihydrofolate synthase/folylpolyglutamate synthase|nr:bifunctional folylpolyglutamate synthase/dihydrofolate synthase [Prevotellaceae bacterium]
MNYKSAINFLYSQAPMFQQVGKKGYKAGLENMYFLDKYFGFPHMKYRTIHVGGTNGKGSVSHLLSAILQSADYKVGLYTSPHLKDFRERIRINGKMISKHKVSAFITENQQLITELNPSFFEITTAFAFKYFAEQDVDFVVVEVGLGGRLDCTNVIKPILSIITNISLDHTDILGDALEKIAVEKAGIIKLNTPVVIGETQAETEKIFREKAEQNSAEIIFADKFFPCHCGLFQQSAVKNEISAFVKMAGTVNCGLKGIYQQKNLKTVLAAAAVLRKFGIKISKHSLKNGLKNVILFTGLQGRWQVLGKNPTIVADTGHNQGGISLVVEQIKQQKFKRLHIVFGMVNDKNSAPVLNLLPKDAHYYFTKAKLPRALDEKILQLKAAEFNLFGNVYSSVKQAVAAAKKAADKDDFIYIGGSTFIVAEAV